MSVWIGTARTRRERNFVTSSGPQRKETGVVSRTGPAPPIQKRHYHPQTLLKIGSGWQIYHSAGRPEPNDWRSAGEDIHFGDRLIKETGLPRSRIAGSTRRNTGVSCGRTQPGNPATMAEPLGVAISEVIMTARTALQHPWTAATTTAGSRSLPGHTRPVPYSGDWPCHPWSSGTTATLSYPRAGRAAPPRRATAASPGAI